jgi:hypothetical protein
MTAFPAPMRWLCLAAVLGLLAGCSGMRLIDTDVSSFARWPAASTGVSGAPGTTYRFERLPSQERLSTAPSEMPQDQLESAAVQALERRGLVLKPDAPLLIVQVGMTSVTQPGGYGSGFAGGAGMSLGTGSAGNFIGLSFPLMRYDPPIYLRELSVVMRDSRSNAVVYESRARHSGIWADARAVWPAMLEAALNGFPIPPQGTRRVNVEIPR